ncbi:hypothetical protein V8F33_006418 [Rhypophila sp. PSN 637]
MMVPFSNCYTKLPTVGHRNQVMLTAHVLTRENKGGTGEPRFILRVVRKGKGLYLSSSLLPRRPGQSAPKQTSCSSNDALSLHSSRYVPCNPQNDHHCSAIASSLPCPRFCWGVGYLNGMSATPRPTQIVLCRQEHCNMTVALANGKRDSWACSCSPRLSLSTDFLRNRPTWDWFDEVDHGRLFHVYEAQWSCRPSTGMVVR